MATDGLAFYRLLPELPSLRAAMTGNMLRTVPGDWFIAVTDVRGSTEAIRAGRYKDVNIAGGLAAIAVCNAIGEMAIPYIFGGDGVTFVLPGEFQALVSAILCDTRQQVKQLFQLNLRVGIVPVSALRARGHEVLLGKLRISPNYTQAVLGGSGAETAESWIKNNDSNNPWLAQPDSNIRRSADFSGFTRRWRDIPSHAGETVAWIIHLREKGAAASITAENLLAKIDAIYGSASEHHPLRAENMAFADSSDILGNEARAITRKGSGLRYQIRLFSIFIQVWLTRIIVRLRIPVRAWWLRMDQIREYNIRSCDFQKFDGTFKMVLSGRNAQRIALQDALEEMRRAGKLNYGVHASNRALLTCLMHTPSRGEVHFVDAADGGYALAAQMLKKQLSALE